MVVVTHFWKVFWTLALVLAGLVTWFLGNLLYTLFWTVLGDWGVPITEAKMTAYIAAHLVPFILILLVGTGFYFFIRSHISTPNPQREIPTAKATTERVGEGYERYQIFDLADPALLQCARQAEESAAAAQRNFQCRRSRIEWAPA